VSSTPIRAGQVTVEEFDDDVCLFLESTGQVVVLNHSAAAIWALIDGERTAADIVDELQRHFSTQRIQLTADVGAVLDQLAVHGFVSGASGTAGQVSDDPRAARA
jgi:hypothetical protein